jgi:hypothetical protein
MTNIPTTFQTDETAILYAAKRNTEAKRRSVINQDLTKGDK